MLMPKRVKYRKPQTAARIKGKECRATTVAFGDYGIKSTEPRWVTARQIEAARITISRLVRKKGRLWIRIFPDKAITKHPAETRMGKGKGAPEVWVAVVKPGRIMFEMDGLTHDEAKEVMRLAGAKLPVKTKLVERK